MFVKRYPCFMYALPHTSNTSLALLDMHFLWANRNTGFVQTWKSHGKSFCLFFWWKMGILKFGKLSGNYHGISQNNHGIPNKHPWIILFAEYYSLKIKMNYLTLYVYVIRHWRSKSGICSVTPIYALFFSWVKFLVIIKKKIHLNAFY